MKMVCFKGKYHEVKLLLLLLSVFCPVTFCQKAEYDFYKLLRMYTWNVQDQKSLYNFLTPSKFRLDALTQKRWASMLSSLLKYNTL